MPLIKRYPNRKLYDTEAKRYVTLHDIAALIRQGEQVSVVDHATGQDLTALTLSQIIFEQEKEHKGFLPRSVLTSLIQAGGDTLGTLQRTLAVSLGFLRQIDEEIERRVRLLISRGELAEEDGLLLLDKLFSLGRSARRLDEPDLERALSAQGLLTRDDFDQLAAQLDALAARLDELSQNTG